MKTSSHVYRFMITLQGASPRVWRRIEVPSDYSLWDLHVAIQDVMGWLDYHLHAFYFQQGNKLVEIGIPEGEGDDSGVIAGWTVKMSEFFTGPGVVSRYAYDFGDDWQHDVTLEEILPREIGVKYPRCIDGRQPCPPEDCGGIEGYARLRRILRNPKHREYAETAEWMAGMERLSGRRRFDEQNPGNVRFDNPRTRWNKAFSGRR
jgi:hypothetical protein